MTQETKVGLIVGLGFIICFAMILVNRSGAERIRPQMPHELFNGAAPRNSASAIVLPESQARRISQVDDAAAPDERRSSAAAWSSDRRDPVREQRDGGDREPEVILDPKRFTKRRQPLPQRVDVGETVVADAGDLDADGMSLLAGEIAPEVEADAPEPDSTTGLALGRHAEPAARAGLPASLRSFADQLEPVRSTAERAAATTEVRHVIRQGETLTGIVRRYYGSRSRAIVNAVFQANRSVLTSPDTMIAGRVLRLPNIKGSAPRPNPSAGEAPLATVAANPAPRQPADYRLYTVKKGDLLGTIAQRELGGARRWKEILALNRDVCSDARHLPCGVEIRIPLDGLADAG